MEKLWQYWDIEIKNGGYIVAIWNLLTDFIPCTAILSEVSSLLVEI